MNVCVSVYGTCVWRCARVRVAHARACVFVCFKPVICCGGCIFVDVVQNHNCATSSRAVVQLTMINPEMCNFSAQDMCRLLPRGPKCIYRRRVACARLACCRCRVVTNSRARAREPCIRHGRRRTRSTRARPRA